jgi:hypothetical protein
MKRSRVIPLVLLGTLVTLAGCGPSPQNVNVRQNAYNSKEDCKKDWGDDDRDCTPRSGNSGYYGPRYIYNHGAGVPMAIGQDGSSRPLANSYLTKPGAVSPAIGATIGQASVMSNSPAYAHAQRAGAVSAKSSSSGSSVSRGGFGSSARASSSGG